MAPRMVEPRCKRREKIEEKYKRTGLGYVKSFSVCVGCLGVGLSDTVGEYRK